MPVHSPFCKFALWVVSAKGAAGYNGHTNVFILYTGTSYMLKHLSDYGVTCMSVLHIQHGFNEHSITNSTEADISRFVHVSIYALVFKELFFSFLFD